MKAIQANLLKFLRRSPQQFAIPIYQRNYSWTQDQCKQLWTDLMRAGLDEKVNAHFIGSIVYIESALSSVTSQEPLLVIDGQQRLTTSTLLIAALAKHFETQGISELLDTFSAKKLRNYYLVNPDEESDRHYKLILSETDKDTLLAILKGDPIPAESSNRINENYALFQELIAQNKDKLEAICQGLAKLVIVDVSLDRTQDNPQMIFESMNSTGLELSQADLIRNFILMGLGQKLQTELYKNYWRPMEKGFGQGAYAIHFDSFMRDYITAKTGDIPNVREVYVAFKSYARRLNGDVSDLVADIHSFAGYYCAIALGAEKDPILKQAFHDLRELKVDVAYPFLLGVYHDYHNKRLNTDELLQIVRWIESYVFRRAICAIPTNSMNKTFAGMSSSLKKDRYVESVQAAFLMLPSYRRFPGDEEFQRDLKTRDLYNMRNKNFWLRRLENHGRKERVVIEDYTIEHIMPQNEALSPEWQISLGPEWQRIQKTWLHTLGNLTLTGYNSEYRDYPYLYKRDKVTDKLGNPIGFAHSPLKLNQTLRYVDVWNEDAINTRADILAIEATNIWKVPQLPLDVLDVYRNVKTNQQYSIADHPHIDGGPLHELFDDLRKSLLDIDPCVVEEFKKFYVAYKAETNFVDVVPQAKKLKIYLNIPFHEIDDPKGLCVDVTGLGHWANGDVELSITTLEELPYAIGLAQQAFDHQMDNSTGA